MTARDLLAAATARLDAAGVASPRVDAELLLAHVLGVERGRLVLAGTLSPAAVAEYDALVARRAAREPLQHLTGHAPFRHVDVAVGRGVFVPRPESELLVDAVLDGLHGLTRPVVVDLCSGSGALALALADEVPAARVVAVERPGPALEWLYRNTEHSAVEVVEADVADPNLLSELHATADAVVCNPPYVPGGAEVEPEVWADPDVAVYAGVDGLALMPAVIARAAELLRPGGVAAIEHDDSHGQSVPALLVADGRWRAVAGHRDLAGRPRYVTATRA